MTAEREQLKSSKAACWSKISGYLDFVFLSRWEREEEKVLTRVTGNPSPQSPPHRGEEEKANRAGRESIS